MIEVEINLHSVVELIVTTECVLVKADIQDTHI
jgi:hypothetical protein